MFPVRYELNFYIILLRKSVFKGLIPAIIIIYTYPLQIWVLFSGSKIYNHLPLNIKLLSKDVKKFRSLLRSYLTKHAFCSTDEFYKTSSQWILLLYLVNNLLIFAIFVLILYKMVLDCYCKIMTCIWNLLIYYCFILIVLNDNFYIL
jgi:hypothetical protein